MQLLINYLAQMSSFRNKKPSLLKGPSVKQVQTYTELFKSVVSSYYKEAFYYLQQPRSMQVRLLFLLGLSYVLFIIHSNNLTQYSSAYKRKRMRIIEIQNANLPPVSREEWECQEELFKLKFPRWLNFTID